MSTVAFQYRIWAAAALVLAMLLAAASASAQVAFRAASSATGFGGTPTLVPNTNPNTAIVSAAGSTATIEFRNSATSTTLVGGNSITISTPASTAENDVMIAVISVTRDPGGGANITTLAGWTSLDNSQVTNFQEPPGVRIRVMWKKATAADVGATHTFALTGPPTAVVGGIMTFSGVDGTNPVVSDGTTVTTTAGATATAPNRLASAFANTMLVTAFTYASSSTWTTPTLGMTSIFDIGSPTTRPDPNGVSLKTAFQAWPTAVDTGDRTSTANSGATMIEGLVGYSLLLRPAEPVVLQTPSGAQAGDVMIATISIRGNSAAAAVRARLWQLVRRVPGAGVANDTQLFVFRRTVTATESATQAFGTFGTSQAVGGIVAYRGVHGTTPIDTENGQATASSLSHDTPQITTTVANTMLVASFGVSSARQWVTAPAGFTERVNVMDPAGGAGTGESLAMYDKSQAAVATVGPFTATITATGSDPDVGATHLLALRPAACAIVIPVPSAPAAVQAGDMMIATIAVRSSAAVVATVPNGWTAHPRQDSVAGDTLSLVTYRKVAGANEAALGSYQWTFNSCTQVVGGIQAFSGVDTSVVPVFASAQSGDTIHTAPSVVPPAAGSMLVPIMAYSSSATSWTKQPGSTAMTQAFHTSDPAPPILVGLDIVGYYEVWAPATASGTRSASVSNDPGIGVTAMLALKPVVLVATPGRFNAYDPPAAAITGVIKTKVAGTSASIIIVAVKTDNSGVETTFNGDVTVQVVDSSTGGSVDSSQCNAAWPVVTTSPASITATLTAGIGTVSVAVPNSYRNARIRVIYPAGSSYAAGTAKGCAVDNFAVRPSSLAIAVTDSNWTTAGTGRALNNTGASGGNVHRAGQPFTITATPAPVTVTNYDGSPNTVSALTCILPAAGTCTPAMLNPGTFSGTGTRVSSAATYSEAGAFNLTLVDTDYAVVDAADTPGDCTSSGRYVCQSAATISVGRFVPDRFAVTAVATPIFRTFDAIDASCSVPPSGSRRNFTYVGQFFGYQTAPSAMISAQNASGVTTTNYRGTLWKLNNASAALQFDNSPAKTFDLTQVGTPTVAETPNTGTGTLTPSASGKLAFQRDNATPAAEFNANISLTLSVSDANEAGANQGTITTATPLVFNGGGTGIAFDGGGSASGKTFRYGRLQLGSANGSQLAPLLVPMETQYWTGTAFAINTLDHCTTLASGSVGMGNYAGNLSSGETTPSLSGAFLSGRKSITMSAPGAGNNGSVDLGVDLGPTSTIDSCIAWGTTPTPTAANQAYLRGRWCGATQIKDPTGRATFGIYRGSDEVIFLRENF